MFVTLGIEQYDATVVEVEGGACACVVFDGVPSLPIAPDTFYNDDGLLVTVGIELLQLRMLLYLDMCKLNLRLEI